MREKKFFLPQLHSFVLLYPRCLFWLVLFVLGLLLSTGLSVSAEGCPVILFEQQYIYDTQGNLKKIVETCGDSLPPGCKNISSQEQRLQQIGKEGEEQVIRELEAKGAKVLGREITLKTSETTTRVDIVIRNVEGNLEVVEVKNGPSVPLTPQQRAAFPVIQQSGAELRGKKAVSLQLPKKIGPTPVRIIRVVTCP